MSQRILSATQFRAFLQNSRPVDFSHDGPEDEADAAVIKHTSGMSGGHARSTLGELRPASVSIPHPERELS